MSQLEIVFAKKKIKIYVYFTLLDKNILINFMVLNA